MAYSPILYNKKVSNFVSCLAILCKILYKNVVSDNLKSIKSYNKRKLQDDTKLLRLF